jgi:nucleoside-diphosphate-sugar epimerase
MTARVLVTGATGAIGRHLLPELLRANLEVRATYRHQPPSLEGVDWQRMDFLESQDFAELVVGCDAVVHLAGDTHVPERMTRLNVDTTAALLKAAQSLGVRYFGYLSTIAVYGSPWRRYIDENSPCLDLSVPLELQYHAKPEILDYVRSKIVAEQSIRAITKDIAADIYRPSIVVDEARVLEAGDWTTARKLAAAYRRTHYIYVKDLAAAILHLTKRGLASEVEIPREQVEVFNITDEACGTYGEILKAAYAATHDARFKLRAQLPIISDVFDDIRTYKRFPRLPLGILRFGSAKLFDTGFDFPYGVEEVLGQVLEQRTCPLMTSLSAPV